MEATGHRKLFVIWFRRVALVIPIAILISLFSLVTFSKSPEVIAKRNLRSVLIAVERYAVDHDGRFPPYLLGGDKEGWDYYNAKRPEGSPYLYDPLIEYDYLGSYPENPFFKIKKWGYREDREAIRKFREMTEGPEGNSFDPRFGLKGNKMGNALKEPFYFLKPVTLVPEDYPRMCPGQFYYSTVFDNYHGSEGGCVLGLFGPMKDPGEDNIRWTEMSGNIPSRFPYISPTDPYLNPWFPEEDIYLRLPECIGGGDINNPPMLPPDWWRPMTGQDVDSRDKYLHWPGDKVVRAPDGFVDGIIEFYAGGSG